MVIMSMPTEGHIEIDFTAMYEAVMEMLRKPSQSAEAIGDNCCKAIELLGCKSGGMRSFTYRGIDRT